MREELTIQTLGQRQRLPEWRQKAAEHRTSAEDLECPSCGEVMAEIGKEAGRSPVMIPAQVKIREDWYYTYEFSSLSIQV